MKTLLASFLMLVSVAACAAAPEQTPQQEEPKTELVCAHRDQWSQILGRHGVLPRLGMVSKTGEHIFEVWTDTRMQRWVLLMTNREHTACLLGTGSGWYNHGPMLPTIE